MPDDIYRNYAQLAADLAEGQDYRIRCEDRGSRVVIVAPHGGGIEPGTSEIAAAVAGTEWSLYCFDGTRRTDNSVLHITSTRFDEPRCQALLAQSETVLVIHGLDGEQPVVWIGGLDRELVTKLRASITLAGFEAILDNTPAHGASHPNNLCNRGSSRIGCQLEISLSLRRSLFRDLTRAGRKHSSDQFSLLCEAIRSALVGN